MTPLVSLLETWAHNEGPFKLLISKYEETDRQSNYANTDQDKAIWKLTSFNSWSWCVHLTNYGLNLNELVRVTWAH